MTLRSVDCSKVTSAQRKSILWTADRPEDLSVVSPVRGYRVGTSGETDVDKEVPENGLGA